MMPIKNTSNQWGLVSQLLHWGIALAIFFMIGLGLYMHDLPNNPTKFKLYSLHKSLGLTIFALAFVRLAWRSANVTPTLPDHLKRYEVLGAKASHHLLYALMILIPISGYVINSAANFPLKFWGWFTIPNWVAESKQIQEIAADTHALLVYLLIAVVVVHAAAALKHHLVDRDNILRRMVPFWRLK